MIEVLERENAGLQKQNAKLLRMVELVMEERFYRPNVTGGVRENALSPGLPIDTLNDVAVFDEVADAAQIDGESKLFAELREVESEHLSWRKEKGLPDVAA